ncbi:MAG: GNAT family N-acetyltransferase, partial [Defluviitaleaceae bacterium]|nr:GNAT family N-acetyltransferase [Defluviitaleaceae bacterium]
VDPEHQGMGLGKKLMEQAICYGVEHGATRGFLAADILNKNAIGLFNKYNFLAKDSDSELQMIRA